MICLFLCDSKSCTLILLSFKIFLERKLKYYRRCQKFSLFQDALIRYLLKGEKSPCLCNEPNIKSLGTVSPIDIAKRFRNQAVLRKLGGRMISVINGSVFFGISDTTRILPVLQHGHSLISTPVSLSIISSIDCLTILSLSTD